MQTWIIPELNWIQNVHSPTSSKQRSSMLNHMLHFCRGVPPSPRSDHAAAVHAEWYLLIFGGGSHATCFNDLHVLDLQTVRYLLWYKQTLTSTHTRLNT